MTDIIVQPCTEYLDAVLYRKLTPIEFGSMLSRSTVVSVEIKTRPWINVPYPPNEP